MGLLNYIDDDDLSPPSGLFGGVRSSPSGSQWNMPGNDEVSRDSSPARIAQVQGQSPSGRPRVYVFAPWAKQPDPSNFDSVGNTKAGRELGASTVSALGLDDAQFDQRFAGDSRAPAVRNPQSDMQPSGSEQSRFDGPFNPQYFTGDSALASRLQQSAIYKDTNVGPSGKAPADSSIRGRAEGYVPYIIQHESKGKSDAKSKTSSAMGLGQFTGKTWLDSLKAYRPDIGGTDEEKLALRSDPKLALEITKALTTENARALEKAGVDPTMGNTYLAHFAGSGKAIKILKADPSIPVSQILSPAAMKANKFLENMTAGDVRKWADGNMATAKKQLDVTAAKNRNSPMPFTRTAPIAFSGMSGQPMLPQRGSIDLSKLQNALQPSGNSLVILGR